MNDELIYCFVMYFIGSLGIAIGILFRNVILHRMKLEKAIKMFFIIDFVFLILVIIFYFINRDKVVPIS